MKQTGRKGKLPTRDDWRSFVSEAVKKADWKKVKQDVQNFLENPSDLKVFSQENVLALLKPF